MRTELLALLLILELCACCFAIEPNRKQSIDRRLRYRPVDHGFVIENGPEFFNRPLYGGNNPFRVDAGDKPEFSLFLPGRGGVLRIGVARGDQARWFIDCQRIATRYADGVMSYEIRDQLLGNTTIKLTAAVAHEAESLLVRVAADGPVRGLMLIAAFGGVNGDRGRRGGDIGTETVPVSQFFQLKPEYCRDDRFEIDGRRFLLRSGNHQVAGVMPIDATLSLADANQWASPAELQQSKAGDAPLLLSRSPLKSGVVLALQRITDQSDGLNADRLDSAMDTAIDQAKRISRRVVVETPDPYINSAVAALCTAADGIWDEPNSAFMHGAVAWRNKLLGWRGAYTGDALGWHDRTRRHLENWTSKQNASDIDPAIQGADPDQALARSERMLHSNGDLTNSHYDMNLVAIDTMFRHILWTGDREYMRRMWPVIVRHLAWERRLFRREFGPDKLPLYEGYACIWASDDLQYSGGGATHSTAYNLWHNLMAARVADAIGEDSTPYRAEAEMIRLAMKQYLWLPEGWYAEFKDLLGEQLPHPAAAVWSYYHAVDSHATDPFQAWQMGRYVETQIPHIPIRGPEVPDENLNVLATTNWMPYTWSINNVVMAENVHTALADWQAQRPGPAFATFKGAVLNSMFMGLCPGNVGMCTQFDVYRRESQRDFADGVGSMSRAVIEGLFGILPDALDQTLTIRPGFPQQWTSASIQHPDISYRYQLDGDTERFVIEPKLPSPMKLALRVPARRVGIAEVTVNDEPAEWHVDESAVEQPAIVIESAPQPHWGVSIRYNGELPARASVQIDKELQIESGTASMLDLLDPHKVLRGVKRGEHQLSAGAIDNAGDQCVFVKLSQGQMRWWMPATFKIRPPAAAATPSNPAGARLEPVDLTGAFNDRVTQIFKNEYRSPRSPYCSLAMPINGLGAWASNKMTADIDDAGLRNLARKRQPLKLPGGITFTMVDADKNVAFCSQWDNYPRRIETPLSGRASHVYLLMAGSTNAMQSRFENGAVTVEYQDGSASRLSLRNPETWWPIEQDYFIDDYQFPYDAPLPPRVDLKTGNVRILDPAKFKGQGKRIPGGSATVLDMALDPTKPLKSLRVEAVANEVVIGLMGATLVRP